MLIVKVYRNNELLGQREVVNISEKRKRLYGIGDQVYEAFDNGEKLDIEIDHNFEDGYWKLAEKVCQVGHITTFPQITKDK